MVIYADVIFAVNAVINYIIMLVTAKICAVTPCRWRMGIAAALGGVYSVLAVLGGGNAFFQQALIKIVAGALMIVVAFGRCREILRLGVVFFASAAVFGGAVLAVTYMSSRGQPGAWLYRPVSLKILILSFAISYFVITLVFGRAGRSLFGGGTALICAETGGRKVSFTALRDNGNSLSDPFSGKHVIVTDISSVGELFPENIRERLTGATLKKPATLMQELFSADERYPFRIIPFRAVGVDTGFLIAVKPEKITVNGKERNDMLIALSPNKLDGGENYSALMGGEKL